MKKITDEFTKKHREFLLGNLLQMTVTGNHPNFLEVATLLNECVEILKNSLGIKPESVNAAPKPLASANKNRSLKR